MAKQRRRNRAQRRLVAALLIAKQPLTNLELSRVTGVGPGRIYMELRRLVEFGDAAVSVAHWEPYPGRYLYSATTQLFAAHPPRPTEPQPAPPEPPQPLKRTLNLLESDE